MTSLSPLNKKPGSKCPESGEEGKSTAPLAEKDCAGYSPPKQDCTRDQYHKWFQQAEVETDVDVGGEGLKNAVSNFENSWYVAAALTMTVGFAFLMYLPQGQYPEMSCGIAKCDEIALYCYVALSLFATINSVLGVWWAGHVVPQVGWHPAAHFSKFWFASINTVLGHSQQFSKIAIEQLVLALIPMCYLNFGVVGLILSVLSIVYMFLQLKTWAFLMNRMRTKYQDGIQNESPEIEDVTNLPHQYCRAPHMEGLAGWFTCQFLGTACFSFRWMFPHKDKQGGVAPKKNTAV